MPVSCVLALVTSGALAQVPPPPVIDVGTATLPAFGPTLALYASAQAGIDGGPIERAEWRFWPTADGGTVTSGPQPNVRYLYLPSYSWLTDQLAQCQPVSFQVQFLNDAGSSGWSAPGGPALWDRIDPPPVPGGNILSPATLGGVDVAFTEVADDCPLAVDYPVFWAAVGQDGGAAGDLGPFPATSPAHLPMGPGTWAVSLASRDPAGNASAAVPLSGTVIISPNASVAAPSGVAITYAPFHNVGYTSAGWTAVPGAAEYVVLLTTVDGGAPLWVQHRSGQSVTLSPLVDGQWLRLSVATVAADGGVSDWAVAQQDLFLEYDPPSIPVGLTAALDGGEVLLAWLPSTDAVSGVAGYEVQQSPADAGSFSLVGSPMTTSLAVPAATGRWLFRVRARDGAGNASGYSAVASLSVGAEGQPLPPQSFRLGCGCASGEAWPWGAWALALWLARSRRGRP